MATLYLVEDHAMMREMLDEFIALEPDLSVVGSASNGNDALHEIAKNLPDLILIDVALPDMSGISLARILHQRYPHLHLLMLSGHGERPYVESALDAGAQGYILKGHAEDIPVAIRRVLRGQMYFSEALRFRIPGEV